MWRYTCSEESKQVKDLMSLITTLSTYDTREDILAWRWEMKGEFMVKLAYKHLIDSRLRSVVATDIWKTKCPLKVKIFLGLIVGLSISQFGSDLDKKISTKN